MSSLKRPDGTAHPRFRLPPAGARVQPARPQERSPAWLVAVYAVIFGTLIFNLALAFINTRVMGISQNHVVLSELLLTACAMLLAMTRRANLYVVIGVYLAYMLMIMALRGIIDPKSVRDALVPVIFYFLGRQIHDIRHVDRLVLWSALLVIAVGLIEYLFLDLFLQNVNIFDYYVARGTITADSNFLGEDSPLFHSGVRLGGRNFFAFLGAHRVSSVFLEPVSMGNFGAFLVMWAVFRQDMQGRLLLFVLAFAVIILGDARFGMFVSLSFFLIAPLNRITPRAVLVAAPILIVLLLIIYAAASNRLGWDDTLTGRWLYSGQLLMKLDWKGILGISTMQTYLSDSGYAFALFQTGAIGLLGLWVLYIYAPAASDAGWRLKVLMAVYICLLMIVSYSLSTIKTGGLLWLCAGAADAWNGRHPAGVSRLALPALFRRRKTERPAVAGRWKLPPGFEKGRGA